MKIGILQTGHSPQEMKHSHGNYDEMFYKLLEGQGFSFENFPVLDGIFPDSADQAEGWLITGSKFGVYEEHGWIPPLEDLIRQIHARGLPMVGVCFGHQIIAQALGGKVEKFAGGWAIGRTEYDIDGKALALNAWHQDQVVDLPEGARVLGGNAFCKNAVLAYGNTIWTIQPHPEFDAAFIDGLIKHRGRGVVPDQQLDDASSQLDAPTHNAEIANQIAAFFKEERA
ncbi:type 1 glutamine amidotransferase [Epibacterium sp. SM1969]|uniref:Type 1 glutamine amidotransferase n=1 Tax=Tritonibacter aquimaris TaxID=2663379 RepID=A0A844ALQ6_9RHOB|nr:type 1 glutamine amidotransferase [Tritonibacter aquimaris]MQY42905.1 type 1 glutamine amidotransferase [Tritonibacter aquimaris]